MNSMPVDIRIADELESGPLAVGAMSFFPTKKLESAIKQAMKATKQSNQSEFLRAGMAAYARAVLKEMGQRQKSESNAESAEPELVPIGELYPTA